VPKSLFRFVFPTTANDVDVAAVAVRVETASPAPLYATSRYWAGVDLGDACGLGKGDAGEEVWWRLDPGKIDLGEIDGE
jgi:hypothetical protein